MERINLVIHRVIDRASQVNSIYDCLALDIEKTIELISAPAIQRKCRIGLFLDDAFTSQRDFVCGWKRPDFVDVYLAVVYDWLGRKDCLNASDVRALRDDAGVHICSHGLQHIRLTKYVSNQPVDPPAGGRYGKCRSTRPPTEQQVLYELNESKALLDRIGLQTTEFVFPYGAFSPGAIRLLRQKSHYVKAYTCEDGIEDDHSDPFSIPRFLLTNKQSPEDVRNRVEKLMNLLS